MRKETVLIFIHNVNFYEMKLLFIEYARRFAFISFHDNFV